MLLLLTNKHLLPFLIPGLGKEGIKSCPDTQCHGISPLAVGPTKGGLECKVGRVFTFPSSSDYSTTGEINERILKGNMFLLELTLLCGTSAKDTTWMILKQHEYSLASWLSETLEVHYTAQHRSQRHSPLIIFTQQNIFSAGFQICSTQRRVYLQWNCSLVTLRLP